ncbi:MAG: GAF domain-containing protein [Anaerolineales bacterium]|nr:GAF domain-containing protein [Anaerolineales bacterium]
MNNSLSHNPTNQPAQGESINRQRVFWASIIFTAVAAISFVFSFFLIGGSPVWQSYLILAITTIALIVDVISVVLITRGQLEQGLKYLFWSTLFTVPPNALLVTNTTPFLIAIILVVSSIHIFYLQPQAWRKKYQFAPIIASILTASVEVFQPSFRLEITGTSPTSNFFGPLILAFLVISLIALVVRQAWAGNIRLKLVTSFTVIALISVAIVGTVVYINYRNQVREDIRQRLLNIVTITAMRLDGDMHATLQTPEDMQTEAYRQMMAEGDEIVATDPDLIFSYTMRLNEQGQIYFVIDSRRADDTERIDIGTIYDEPSETLQAFFKAPDRPIVEKEIYTDAYNSVLSAFAPFYRADGSLEGILGIDIAADAVLEKERNILYLILGTTLGTMFLVTLLGLYLGNVFTNPIIRLSQVAQKIAAGDLSARAKIEATDEVGDLAVTINTMTAQLQETLQSLEQRVADRTRNLELAAEVGRSVSQVGALDVILKNAAEIIRSRFNLYYVQVYLTDPSQTNLLLLSGTGKVGEELLSRNHRLPLNTGSINGRAAIERKSVVITDTTANTTFRPNPLLPHTRSEMAMPLLVGDKVVGVLDLQSEQTNSLNQEILPAFEALAGQLAIAIQNASLLAETEQARAEVESQARRLTRANWMDYLDAIHKPEEIGFVFEQNKISPLTQAQETQTAENSNAFSAPISVTGEALGNLIVEMEGQNPIARTSELVNTVARQVAQQIESLRLLGSAERYRAEAEQASRRLTRENWQEYKQANTEKSLSYLYDQKEVRAYNHEGNEQPQSSDLNLPLKIRDEEIGQVVVQGFDTNNPDNLNLASAVVERLSQHIESLRLLEKTEESRSEIQTSQERLSEALGIAKLANWEYDVEKDLFQFNDNFYAVLHTTVQEVGGYQLASADYASRFVHPDDVPIVGVEIGKALNSTERHFSSSVEHRVIFADGEVGYLSVRIQVERDEEGKITRYYGANQDVTERRRAEEELRTREAQLSAVLKQTEKLFEASRRLTQVGDLQELVKTTVEIFDIPVINGAELDLFSYDARGDLESLTVIANWWNGTGTAPGAVGSRFSKEMFSAVKLFLTSTPVFISDALDSERVDAGMMRIVKAFNIRAVTFLPLFIGANQIGVLVMHAEETHDFTEDETRLFSGLAPQIATVLENRHQYQRAQQQAERESTLNTISQKIQSATTVEAVLQIAARELGHALGAPMTIAQLSMKDKK